MAEMVRSELSFEAVRGPTRRRAHHTRVVHEPIEARMLGLELRNEAANRRQAREIELRHLYTEALEEACATMREIVGAYEARQDAWMRINVERLKVQDARVRRIKHALTIGVAA